jgi:hypothetical protein
MIAIYRGEDTDFAGQEPIQVKINTPLDLTGYTADLLFGSVVKHFEAEEVGTKVLGLSFTAAETSGFFPGQGFASIKVYDTEGRVAILKRFIIDVRFRSYDKAPATTMDISEAMKVFENIRDAAISIPELTDDDDISVVRDAINKIVDAARKREEFAPIPIRDMSKVSRKTISAFYECIKRLESLKEAAESPDADVDYLEVVKVLNNILDAFCGRWSSIDLKDPDASVNCLVAWSKQINRILRIQVV